MLEGGHIHAAGRESGLRRGENGVAGDGGAGHGVRRQALLLHDAAGNGVDRLVADAGRFVGFAYGDSGDAAVLIADGHRHIAAHAGSGGGVVLRKCAGAGCDQNTGRQNRNRFFQ